MRSIRFGLIVIAISGLIVLAAGIEVGIWSREGEGLAIRQEFVGDQMLVLRHTNEALVELESGQRGYLLTGDAAYLDFYNQARRDLAVALTALDKAFAAGAPRSADIAEVARLARAKEAEAARSVQLRLEGRQTAPMMPRSPTRAGLCGRRFAPSCIPWRTSFALRWPTWTRNRLKSSGTYMRCWRLSSWSSIYR